MRFEPWTFGLQAANFLVLLWLLHRFLYRPVLGIIAARQAATDKLSAELEQARAEVEARRRALEDQQAALAADRDKALEAARAAAEGERAAILERARAEADAARAQASLAFEHERAEIVTAAGRDAARLAAAIVRRLLEAEGGAAIQADLLDRVCADVAALADGVKRQIAARLAAGDGALEVVTAQAMAPAAADAFAARLSEALGAPAAPRFRVDPALLAGAEIHFPFTILRRSWAEQLQTIEAALTEDDDLTKRA